MRQFLLIVMLVNQAFGASRLYELQRFDNCREDQPITLHLVVNNSTALPDKIRFGGYLEVTEKIPGPLEMSIDANRCDYSMKKCEKFSSIKIPGVCDVINSKTGIFIDVLKTFEPRITCPWMPGKNVAKDTFLDLSSISGFPTNGFTWVVTIKGISGDGKNRKLVFCTQVECKILKVREGKKRN